MEIQAPAPPQFGLDCGDQGWIPRHGAITIKVGGLLRMDSRRLQRPQERLPHLRWWSPADHALGQGQAARSARHQAADQRNHGAEHGAEPGGGLRLAALSRDGLGLHGLLLC